MHLVTKSKSYRTEKNNLNFIFCDSDNWDEYWEYYYLVVPQLMSYVVEICEAIFLSVTEVDDINCQFNRFIRYVKIDTRANASSDTIPSTESQLVFAEGLSKELKEIGLSEVTVDENGYVMATLPSNTDKDCPVIGFISHLD